MVVLARKMSDYKEVVQKADIVVADGVGVKIALRLLTGKRVERIAGIELAEELLRLAEVEGYRVYLLGAKEDVIEQAVKRLKQSHPRLDIVGYHHGYFEVDDEEVIKEVVDARPDILLVGLGAPKQEFFISKIMSEVPASLMMGVGGSFDVWAGVKKRAWKWMQKLGLEWLFRAMQDLSRIKRLTFIPSFILMVIYAKLRGRTI